LATSEEGPGLCSGGAPLRLIVGNESAQAHKSRAMLTEISCGLTQ